MNPSSHRLSVDMVPISSVNEDGIQEWLRWGWVIPSRAVGRPPLQPKRVGEWQSLLVEHAFFEVGVGGRGVVISPPS